LKEHFEEHLNEGSESEQPTRPVDLRDNGVDIDFPSREEIEGALKYRKNNKAAGADSIAAKLLKNGGPNLEDALHEAIQQAWTSETLPRSCSEGVLCRVYKKGDCKNYRHSLHQNSIRPPLTPSSRSALPEWVPG
jgi:hypothetical protein